MKNNYVNFGILGLGRVVEKRVANVFLKELKGSKVTNIFDINLSKKKKFQKIFNCAASKNLSSFLSEKYDFIYIATESGNHYSHIKECFKYNQNVIVEKPPVLKVNQLKELDKIAKIKKLKFYSIYQNRLNKSVKFLKNYLENNKNKIIFSTLNLSWSRDQDYYSDWHGNWKLDGGVASQQGIHYIDILCYLFGPPIKCISHISKKSNKLEAEDTHTSLIVFKNNITCTCNFTTALRPQDFEASIKLTMQDRIFNLQGLCCNEIEYIDLKKNKNLKLKKLCAKNSEKVKTGYGNSHFRVFQNIINENLKKNEYKNELPLKALNTLATLKLLNMMYMSYEKNSWIYYDNKKITSKLGN